MRIRRNAAVDVERVNRVVGALEVPDAVYKTCSWQPRAVVEAGLRQWLRCAGAALQGGQVIGMPSKAVDDAWHGLILCTARYATFCDAAYGQFLHHHPEGGAPRGVASAAGSMTEQLGRTVVAWSIVAKPGEACVLWDLDTAVGVDHPWGVPADRVAAILADLGTRSDRGAGTQ